MKKRYWVLLLIVVGVLILINNASAFNWTDGSTITYYTFNETTGNLIDLAGATDLPEFGTVGTRFGIINNSRGEYANGNYFNGTTNTSILLNTSSIFSISIWFNVTNNAANQTIFAFDDVNNDEELFFHMKVTPDNKIFGLASVRGGASDTFFSTEDVSLNTWNNLVLVHNESDGAFHIYLNATRIGQIDALAGATNPSTRLTIGRGFDFNDPMLNGFIDEFGLWDVGLTQTNITELFNGGEGITFLENPDVSVNLNSPPTNTNQTSNVLFNATLTPFGSFNLTNATLSVWYTNGSLFTTVFNEVTGNTPNSTTFNVTNLSKGDFIWNVLGVGENLTATGSSFAPLNFTFSWDVAIFDSFTFTSLTTEGNIDPFSTIVNVDGGLSITSANLFYNGVLNIANIINLGGDQFNITLNHIANSVTADTNFTFFWQVFVSDGSSTNSSSNNQTVLDIGIDDCSTNTLNILNYNLVDEDTQLAIDGVAKNGSISVTVQLFSLDLSTLVINFSRTYNQTNNASVCLDAGVLNSSSYSMFTTTQYSATDYQTEWHHIQNKTLDNASIPINITLFDLLTSRATVFKLVFKDSSFLPVEDAIIQIDRSYPGEGIFRSVEAPKTSSLGETTANLVKDSETYNFVVIKNGTILAIFNNQIPFCDDSTIGLCFITLNQLTQNPQLLTVDDEIGLIFTFNYNETSRVLSFQFTTTSGSPSNVTLQAFLNDNLGTTQACDVSLVSASGTLLCTVPASIGNETIVVNIIVDGVHKYQTFIRAGTDIFLGDPGYFLLLILVLSLALMLSDSKTLTVSGVMLGFIVGSLFLFIRGGILAVGSAVGWLIVMGLILIWKLNKDGQS